MQLRHRSKIVGFLVAVVCTLFVGLAVKTPSVHAEPTYTIGTNSTFEPFTIQDKNGGYSGKNPGIEIEILRAVAKHEHFKYRYKIMSFNGDLQALSNGQVDAVMAGMSVTNERKQKFDFSRSYYNDGVVMAVPKSSHIKKFSQLKGRTVDAKSGTSAAIMAKKYQKKYGYKIKYFESSNNMWNDVKIGHAAATFDDEPVLKYGIKNGIPLKIVTKAQYTTPIAVGFKKGKNLTLQHKMNAGINWLYKTGRMKKIVNKYTKSNATHVDTAKERTIPMLIKNNSHALLAGLWETIELAVVGIVCALIFGIILGVMGISQNKVIKGISSVIIYIFRGLPMMVLAFFIYIGLPGVIGHKIPLFTAGIMTLMLDEGAYVGAIVKGGFNSVDPGQWEAARSLGMTYSKALRKVIAPQGFKLMVPPLVNQFIITLKDTSILSAIGVMELTETGTVIIAQNMEGFKMWLIIGTMYIIIVTLLTWLSNYVQKKMN